MSAQIIEKDGKPEFAVIPYGEYEQLMAFAEDKADIADIIAFRESKEETFPEAIVDAILDGENPIRVYRVYRRMTQGDLAVAIQKSLPYIAKLESGDRKGTVEVLVSIAEALEVDLEMLI